MSLHLPLLTRAPRVTRAPRLRWQLHGRTRQAYGPQLKDYSALPVCGSAVRPLASQLDLRARQP